MTPKKKKETREISKQKPIWTKTEGKGKRRKIKQELTVLSAHHVHIEIWRCTSEWSHFHWRVCQENMGNRLETRLTQNIEGFLPRSRLVRGILIEFSRLLPLNRKSSSLWRTLRLTRKAILIEKKAKYVRQTLQRWHIFSLAHRVQLLYILSKGNDAHD